MTQLNLNQLSIDENKRLNVVAEQIRQEFNAIIESISSVHLHNINWIVGSIASRNKYHSPFFMRLCMIAFVQNELLLNDGIDEIILSDKTLATVLQNHYRKQNKCIKVHCTETFTKTIWRLLRPFRQYCIAIMQLFLRWLGRSRRSASIKQDQPITLIDTFILNNQSGDEGSLTNGIYKDRYYPGLLEQLTEDEKQHVYFMPTIVGFKNPIRIFKEIRSAQTQFLIHDDFLTTSDYLFILLHPYRLLRCRIPNTLFRNVDVTPLLVQEKWHHCSDFISLLGLLYYRFAYRLKLAHIKVRLLIEWYENQVMDRGMIVGFRRFHPNTIINGYQGYVIAKNLHLYTLPNQTEYLAHAVPHVVSVVGEKLQADLVEFCQNLTVAVAPGFRFQKLWRKRVYFPDQEKYTILVGLPISLADSAHILMLLEKCLQSLHTTQIQFWIKPHPTWDSKRIKRLLPTWPPAFQFKTGDFHETLERAHLLISNASSVSLEALAKGVFVIIIGAQQGITQNPIPLSVSKKWWSLVYTSDECVEAINQFKQCNQNDTTLKWSECLREQFFEPITRQTTLRFLALDKDIT